MRAWQVLGLLVGSSCVGCGGATFESAGSGGDGGVSSGGAATSVGGSALGGGAAAEGGGAVTSGGATGEGGRAAETGGETTSGGFGQVTGGASSTGGHPAGGHPVGGSVMGGTVASGGRPATGGVTSGGSTSQEPTGGVAPTGGKPATGGTIAVGGVATGGRATGGTIAIGGTANGGRTTPWPTTGGRLTGGTNSGGLATGGSSTGGTSTGGAGAMGGYPECTTAKDCVLLTDCCSCLPLPVGSALPVCDLMCIQSNCAARGIGPEEVACVAGRCVLSRTCNPARVLCDGPVPQCAAGEAPLIASGCYAGGCARVEDCSDVLACDVCKAAGLACATLETMAPSYHCVSTPRECVGNPTCACMGVCNGAGLYCVDPGSTSLTCSCPAC